METEKLLIAGLLITIVSVGLAIGVSIALTPVGNTNTNGGSSSTPSLSTDTDFGQTREAPDWGLLMSDGEILQLSSLEGKFVLVDLMSLTCPACETENSEIQSLSSAMGESLHIISLSVDISTTFQQMDEYKTNNALDWPHGLDTNSAFTYYFNLRYTPTMVLIDFDGYIRMYHEGVWTSSDVQSTISLMDRT